MSVISTLIKNTFQTIITEGLDAKIPQSTNERWERERLRPVGGMRPRRQKKGMGDGTQKGCCTALSCEISTNVLLCSSTPLKIDSLPILLFLPLIDNWLKCWVISACGGLLAFTSTA